MSPADDPPGTPSDPREPLAGFDAARRGGTGDPLPPEGPAGRRTRTGHGLRGGAAAAAGQDRRPADGGPASDDLATGHERHGAAGEAAGLPGGPGPRWFRDLGLGVRFAVGGREGWIRTGMTALGVGLGVALLLLAAAVPAMMDARDQKRVARDLATSGYLARPTASTLLVTDADTTFRGKDITGVLVHPEGPDTERPPGVDRLPGTGEMVVSPALRKLLASSPLLRQRLPYTVTGTIGQAGLMGPTELYYYAGSDRLVARDATFEHGNAERAAEFGHRSNSQVMGPTFDLLLVMVLVALLLPITVFIGTAVRLGGERRDRRLAALRLVGADLRTTRRIAAGEALLGAVFGLALGGGFFLLGRRLAAHLTVRGISAFPSDLRPDTGLTALVALAVPVASVAVTLAGLRGTAIEPLGVVRRAVGRPRRLWWRLLLPALGLALLAPLFGQVRGNRPLNEYQVAAGAVLVLLGVTTVLPWCVEAIVGRLRGGPLPWQLAVRRLQLDSSAAARTVSGVTVAVAGAIALQMLFGSVDGLFVARTGADPTRAQAVVSTPAGHSAQVAADIARLRATRGVKAVYGHVESRATQGDASAKGGTDPAYLPFEVGDCPTLRQMARIASCAPGDVFLVPPTTGEVDATAFRRYLAPGRPVELDVAPGGAPRDGRPDLWTIPAGARTVPGRTDPEGDHLWGVFATQGAIDTSRLADPASRLMVVLDPKRPDAMEYVRNAAARMDIGTYVYTVRSTTRQSQYAQLRRGLFAGATLTMALIGASLLVSMLEQLRERRRLLAVLVAFGTRRGALAWSVLWQTAVPVVLGLLLACAGGIGLGAALLAMVGDPFRVGWDGMLTLAAVGAAVVLAVTLLSLPPLWRLMRADGLRTE